MKKFAFVILLFIPLISFGQAEKRYRSIIVDSLKALNGGRVDVKDTLLLDSLAVYNTDLSSQYTSRSIVDSAFVGSAISGSGHAPVTLSGTPNYITLSGQDIIRGQIDLGTDITGTTTATSISDFDTEVSNNASVTANTAKVTNATHTGDVTGATALTIANKAVEVVMLDDGTDGELITWDASGVSATVSTGSIDQVLTSNGAGSAPTFKNATGGGDSSFVTIQVDSIYSFNNSIIDFDTSTMVVDVVNNRVGIGIIAPTAKLHVVGINAAGTSSSFLATDNVNTHIWDIRNDGNINMGPNGFNGAASDNNIHLNGANCGIRLGDKVGGGETFSVWINSTTINWGTTSDNDLQIFLGNVTRGKFKRNGDFGIGTGTGDVDARMHIVGENNIALDTALLVESLDQTDLFSIENNGSVIVGKTFATAPKTQTLGVAVINIVIESNIIILTGDGGANTIATMTSGVAGQIVTLLFTDALITITDDNSHTANTIDLSAAFTSADDTILQLMFDGTSWYETSRSVN